MVLRPRTLRPLADRFWEKVDKTDGCWLWTASASKAGYGLIGRGGRGNGMAYAHRTSWEFANGAIPAGLNVCHHCDTPRCVRPDHLFLGTRAANMRDMSAKSRQWQQVHPERRRRGEANNLSKLTEEMVGAIRQSGEPTTVLAHRYGLDRHTVARIRAGRTWQHIALDVTAYGPLVLRGEAHSQARLNEDDVRAIRASAEPSRAMAARYGVSKTAILFIRNRHTWRHVA